jgi:putative ABC transport system substrate-binding protein
MKRRDFLGALGAGAAATWPVVSRAQQTPRRMARIAYLGALSASTLDPRQIEAFKQGLQDNGFVEGRNITVDYVWAEGSPDRMRELSQELAQRNFDVIVTAGPQPVLALMATKTTTPIVFAIVGDPMGNGIVKSLARPEGNVTGLSMSNTDLESKRIEILKDTIPALNRIMILHDPSMGSAGVAEAQAAAQTLGIEPRLVGTSDPGQFDEAFKRAVESGVNGLATMASPFLNFHRKRLIELAALHRLPSIWETASFVRDGGLLSYGPSFADMYRRSAGYVAKILNGAKPADLPVEQPIRFELAVNLKIAKMFGLTVPPTLIARADEVIE